MNVESRFGRVKKRRIGKSERKKWGMYWSKFWRRKFEIMKGWGINEIDERKKIGDIEININDKIFGKKGIGYKRKRKLKKFEKIGEKIKKKKVIKNMNGDGGWKKDREKV